jgi:hypothetical protein
MSARKRQQPRQFKITVNFEGREYTATYSVVSDAVEVHSEYGSQTSQSGGTSGHTARMLFREILQGAKARGEIR